MDRYEKGAVIGEGGSSKVYRGVDKETGQVVALKKIRIGHVDDGMNRSAVREVKALRELRHAHLIRLLDVFPHKQNIVLVYEFMESNLELMLQKGGPAVRSERVVKAYVRAALQALAACHCSDPPVLHRDIKPNNLLVAADGTLRLSDFGLSRLVGDGFRSPKTVQAGHLWYRAPELLLGDPHYGPAVDLWSMGCVFAELMLGRPLFSGRSDLDQLTKVFQQMGSPPSSALQGLRLSDCLVMFQDIPGVPLTETFAEADAASENALSLLAQLLALDPAQRPSATQALAHPYFSTGEPVATLSDLPKPGLWAASVDARVGSKAGADANKSRRRAVLFKMASTLQTPSAEEESAIAAGSTAAVQAGGCCGEAPQSLATPGSQVPPVTLSRLRFSTDKKSEVAPVAAMGLPPCGASDRESSPATPTHSSSRVVSNLFDAAPSAEDALRGRSPRGFPHPQLMVCPGGLEDAEVVHTGLTPLPELDSADDGMLDSSRPSSLGKRKVVGFGADNAARSLF